MALTSPGVEVSIIDQSQYLPAPTNSVPLVVLATAQNKADASGTGVAAATTAANAGKLFQITSQRDLVNLYGKPFFYSTTNGTPIQGYELNEYGLLAAYSLLGVTNRCYVLRADIDLASLVGQTGRPVGEPVNDTYWLDTTTSTWGIYVFNKTTGSFTLQTPIVITDEASLDGIYPKDSIGSIGDYAINAIRPTNATYQQAEYFYKTSANTWVELNSDAWRKDVPTIQASNSNPALTVSTEIQITMSGLYSTLIELTDTTVNSLAIAINNLGWSGLSASVTSGKLNIFSNQIVSSSSQFGFITIGDSGGLDSPLAALGIQPGTYYQPIVSMGTSAQMPLWTSSQSTPRPTGSVWVKTGSAGNGLTENVSVYNSTVAAWQRKTVNVYSEDLSANASLDPTGGQAIPAGTVYADYSGDRPESYISSRLFERIATGPTVITGSTTNPIFSAGPYYMNVNISEPGSSDLSDTYRLFLGDNTTAVDFVTAWFAAGIPYTSASITTSGAIQLTHTLGGSILLDDTVNSTYVSTGISNGLIEDAGFIIGSTTGCRAGASILVEYAGISHEPEPGLGVGATFDISQRYSTYSVIEQGVSTGGTDYAIGDLVTISGLQLGGVTPDNDVVLKVTDVAAGSVVSVTFISGVAPELNFTILSNWVPLEYVAADTAPTVAPANNTNWFYSVVDEVDIMVNKGGQWKGYRTVSFDSTGHPASTGINMTDPNGPIVSASEPTTQSDGTTALAYGDLWINTTDLENYPVIYRWQSVGGTAQWVLINNTDQTSSSGVLFADARWATNGTTNPTSDAIPTIVSLLSSNYLDLDAPDSNLYPQGMLLFNTRRSGYNVKQYRKNYFNNTTFPDTVLPAETSAWVSASGLQSNGAPYMGRKAQRAMVVQALRSSISTNLSIRDEDNFFNLMATPNYPELQPDMVVLNGDRGETAYIIGDTPMRLSDSATDIQAWANNEAGATSTGEEGLVTRNTYMGLFYPSGLSTDLDGNLVAVPASHMMLRTFLRNDTVAYPWLAAAGTRRGTIDNASNIGYLDSATGEFTTIKTRIGIRDVLYINFINPLVFFTGVGLLNYGNKTSFNSQSALDRTNVARLVAYIRRQLTIAARPFVFEPNDALTRSEISGVVETLLVDLVAKRGIYDYLVVCDESNNTPARIDRNELWIDVAVEPVKAAEFIYIPVRIMNTGEVAGA